MVARRAAARAWPDRGPRPPALHHLAPARHGRRPDRGASRRCQADALAAPAGAIGLGSHPDRDEPPPRRRRLSRPSSSGCARRGRTSRFSSDFIVGFPGESEADFDATLRLVRDGRLCLGLFLQIFAPPRHAWRRAAGPGRGRRQERAPRRASRRCSAPAAGLQPAERRPHHATCCSSGRAACRGRSSGRSPYLQSVQVEAAPRSDRHHCRGLDRRRPAPGRLHGTLPGASRPRAQQGGGGVKATRNVVREPAPMPAAPIEAPAAAGPRSSYWPSRTIAWRHSSSACTTRISPSSSDGSASTATARGNHVALRGAARWRRTGARECWRASISGCAQGRP